MQTHPTSYDTVILGAGMAGLGLACQLKKQDPALSILVLDKRVHPAPEAAYKVGESTVEVGAWYLEHVLGLSDHLHREQLPKYGLRFFFTEPHHTRLDDGLEVGLNERFPHTAFQLDRGRLENHMVAQLQAQGVTVTDGARLDDVVLGPDKAPHRVTYHTDQGSRTVTCDWVVDATGRAGVLKRRLGMAEKSPHKINAFWFRLQASLRIDDWHAWRVTEEAGSANATRWLSTIHLMGQGYWIWLIPLQCGATSVGIVADPRFHDPDALNSFDKALAWLHVHQPLCARAVARHADTLMDFKALKHFSYGCKQLFSAERWALVGEAGFFPDPFYSPGADYIAIGNTFTCALIARARKGRPIDALAGHFNHIYGELFTNTMRIYKDQYQLFGNPGVMTVKIVWDYTTYWAFVAFCAMQDRFCDVNAYGAVAGFADGIGALNARMQAFFRQWHALWAPRPPKAFLDQWAIPLVHYFNAHLTDTLDTPAFIARLEENLATLTALAAVIVERACRDFPQLAEFHPGPAAPPNAYMDVVWEALEMTPAEVG